MRSSAYRRLLIVVLLGSINGSEFVFSMRHGSSLMYRLNRIGLST